MYQFLKTNLHHKIVHMMVARYENECNNIAFNRINYIKVLVEYDAQLDMQEALIITLYRNNYDEKVIKNFIEIEIFNRYIGIWNAYKQQMEHERPEILKKLTDFTAIILLKMKYRVFIFLYVHNLSEIVNLPNVNNYSEHKTSVRVYHELKDTFMLVPLRCSEFYKLKPCFIYYTNEAIRYLSSKYQLKRSIGGIGVFGYLHDIMIEFFSKPNNLVYRNFTLMKNFFYQNLFSMLQNYKNIFLVKNEVSLDELENMIGRIINQQRIDVTLSNINQGLID